LIGFLAKKGYELFGGKKAKNKIWIVCGATVFGVILGNILPDIFDFARLIYKGEIEGAVYSDIPSLYINWVRFNNLLSSILLNMGLGLLFGIIGLSSIFKEMSAEISPAKPVAVPVQPPLPENPLTQGASLNSFSVVYSGRVGVLILCIFIIPVGVIVIFMLVAGGVPEGLGIGTFIGTLTFLALIALPFLIYFSKLKKFRIDVNGDTLKITPVFGKEKTLRFKDITKVAIYPPYSTVFFYIKAYSKGRRLFNIMNSFNGSKELMERLKSEDIPFSSSLSPF